MSLKGKNLGLRTVSGAVLGVVVVGAALLSKWAFAVVAVAVTVGVMVEMFRMVRSAGNGVEPQELLALCLGVALVVESTLVSSPVVLLTLLMFLPFIFIAELARGKQRPLENISLSVASVVYGAVPMALMMLIGSHTGSWEPAMVLAVIFVVWVNDILCLPIEHPTR